MLVWALSGAVMVHIVTSWKRVGKWPKVYFFYLVICVLSQALEFYEPIRRAGVVAETVAAAIGATFAIAIRRSRVVGRSL